MKPRTPKCNPIGWVWIEMCAFESETDRLQCLELLQAGYAYPFKKFFLKHAHDKVWFRVRQRERSNIAWLNGAAPNHCTRLLQWLRDSKRNDERFRARMGWPIASAGSGTASPVDASACRNIAVQRIAPDGQPGRRPPVATA